MKMLLKLFTLPVFAFLLLLNIAVGQTKIKVPSRKTEVKPAKTVDVFKLKINAKGFADSTVAVIINPQNQSYQGPFGYVKNQQVTISGKLEQEDVYVLLLSNTKNRKQDKYYNMFLSNEESEISIARLTEDLTVVKGSTIQAFDQLLHVFGNDFNSLSANNQLKTQPLMNIDSLNKSSIALQQGIIQKVPYFVQSNSNSPVAAYLINTIKPITTVAKLQEWYNLLQPTAKSSTFGLAVGEFITTEKVSGEGQIAPNFSQTDTIGKMVSLSDFKGKYVLIDFWASWCGPCRQENPNVVNAYNQYKNKNFTILSVSLDKEKGAWLKAIHDDGLIWTHVSDLKFWSNAVAQQFQIQSIPQNMLIGPDGKIVAKNLRGGVLQSYLADLLK